MPAARGSMRLSSGESLSGATYVERLALSIPPWELPITELRWGRWIDANAGHSVVWIDWRGSDPRTWVFMDGCRVSGAGVSDSVVAADGVSLALGSPRVLVDRHLGDVFRQIGPLRGIVPAALHSYHEVKWTSAGVLTTPAFSALDGRTVYEVVRFA